jgi:hypothetical protein
VVAFEFAKLMAAAKPAWRLLFGLARWAALRLEEALELPCRKVDLPKRRLTVISRDDDSEAGGFTVKDKDARVVPIGPELYGLLRDALDPDADLVIPQGAVVYSNVWRDFQVIATRAGVARYKKPIHSLRKSCITDWAAGFAAHVVKEWAGHADIRTTLQYYLKVSESEYDRAAGLPVAEADYEQAAGVAGTAGAPPAPEQQARGVLDDEPKTPLQPTPAADDSDKDVAAAPASSEHEPETVLLPFPGGVTKNVTKKGDSGSPSRRKSKAGDRIRTGDVQLGNTVLRPAEKPGKGFSINSLRRKQAVCKHSREHARICEQ